MDNRYEDKIDRIAEDITEMKQILAINTKELEIHIEGVKLAREQNNLLRQDMEARFDKIDSDIKPIKNHVSFVKGAIWAIGIVGIIVMGLHELNILQKIF